MAVKATLSARGRDGTGKGYNRKLRASGRVPAIIYGHHDAARAVTVDGHELGRLFAQIHIESTVIDLQIDDERTPVRTLVREVQRHAVREDVLHVDFYVIHAGEKVTVEIPLRIQGSAPGVRVGGLLQQSLDTIEVRCLPDSIPDTIDVDISALEIGDSVHVGDLTIPEGVEVLEESERTVCSVIPPTVAPAEEGEEEAREPEPEVIGRGREEEGEGD